MNWSDVKSITIPEGNVLSIYVDGIEIWKKIVARLLQMKATNGNISEFNPDDLTILSNLRYVNKSRIVQPPYLSNENISAFNTVIEVNDASNKISAIGDNAFYYCSNLSAVNCPGVKSIGSGAFVYCTNLSSINCYGVKSIGDSAFNNCLSLSSIECSDVTDIGTYAFSYSNLSSMFCPNLSTINGKTFANCSKLSSIHIDNDTFKSFEDDTIVLNVTNNSLVMIVPVKTTLSNDTIKTIGESAAQNTQLKFVDISSATTLNASAFQNSNSLSSVNAPSLTSIGNYALQCGNLSSLSMLWISSVPSLANSTYSIRANNTVSVYIPNKYVDNFNSHSQWKGAINANFVAIIGIVRPEDKLVFVKTDGTTYGYEANDPDILSSIQFVNINHIVQSPYRQDIAFNEVSAVVDDQHLISAINANSFDGCNNLRSISCEHVTTIKNAAFHNCFNLSSAYFPILSSVGVSSFANCYDLKSINADNLSNIPNIAFYGCKALTHINAPKCTTLGVSALANCRDLTELNVIGDEFGDNALNNTHSLSLIMSNSDVTKSGNWLGGSGSNCAQQHICFSNSLDYGGLTEPTKYLMKSTGFPYGSKANTSIFHFGDHCGYNYTISYNATADGYKLSCSEVDEGDSNCVTLSYNTRTKSSIYFTAYRDKNCVSAAVFYLSCYNPYCEIGPDLQCTVGILSVGNYLRASPLILPATPSKDGDVRSDVYLYGISSIGQTYSAATTKPIYTSALTAVRIGPNINTLETSAFANAYNLETVNLYYGCGLTAIPQYAFANSTNLYELEINNNNALTKILQYAFFNCYTLYSFNLGNAKNLQSINTSAFINCWNIDNFYYDSSKANLSTYNTFPFGLDNTYCYAYFEDLNTGYKITPDKCHRYIARIKNPVQLLDGDANVTCSISCDSTFSLGDRGYVIYWGDGKSTYYTKTQYPSHTYSKMPTTISAKNAYDDWVYWKPAAMMDICVAESPSYQISISADSSEGLVNFYYKKSGETEYTKCDIDVIQNTLAMHANAVKFVGGSRYYAQDSIYALDRIPNKQIYLYDYGSLLSPYADDPVLNAGYIREIVDYSGQISSLAVNGFYGGYCDTYLTSLTIPNLVEIPQLAGCADKLKEIHFENRTLDTIPSLDICRVYDKAYGIYKTKCYVPSRLYAEWVTDPNWSLAINRECFIIIVV